MHRLDAQYNSVSFETVHTKLGTKWWPKNGQTILNIVAGNGQDAQWLNERGCKEVVAVEPADALRTLGVKTNLFKNSHWLSMTSYPNYTKCLN